MTCLESTPYASKQIEAILFGAIIQVEKARTESAELKKRTVKYHKKKFELEEEK